MTKKQIPVVVCTEAKGVFFGYIDENQVNDDPLTLTLARMCVYWSADMKGVMGLASHGPSNTCKVSRAVPKIMLKQITAVIAVSEDAVLRWEKGPWAQS